MQSPTLQKKLKLTKVKFKAIFVFQITRNKSLPLRVNAKMSEVITNDGDDYYDDDDDEFVDDDNDVF
jgi:hypothetical protein